ncbi:TPA: hypothetical protein ACOBTX_000042 [Enterococcus faecium]
MKAKELIPILQLNPEAEIVVSTVLKKISDWETESLDYSVMEGSK